MSRFSRFKPNSWGQNKAQATLADSDIESFPSGIKILFDPPDAACDIVFVHGLTGDRERTWTSPITGASWPRDFLPVSLPDARVLTFGYDAYVVRKHGSVAQIDISHHANDLLNALANERQGHDSATRPLIFVAHSLGGVLCKDALRISEASGDANLAAIVHHTRGIAFIGTPHGGSWLASWAKTPAAILGLAMRTDLSLLSLLKPNSEVLSRIHDDFLSMIRRRGSQHHAVELACFYETLPLVGRTQIVDQLSATIPGFNNISIHADHRDVARYHSAEHPGLKSIVGILERWARPPVTAGGLSADAKAFLETLSFSEMGVRQATIEHAHAGTCRWMLEDPHYKAWVNCQDLDNSHGLLWIKGKPGSGKSTLMKYIASEAPRPKGLVRLAFFFNARGGEEERNAQGLFKTFLHQLVQESPAMTSRLLTHFRRKKAKVGNRSIIWSPAELRDIFFDTIRFNSRTPVEIFVDALDECKEEEVRTIIAAFERCAAETVERGSRNIKICWSSRHYPHISIDHGFEIRVELENLGDITLYVQRHMARSKRQQSFRSLEEKIVEKSKGVFLWAVLVVHRICKLADKGLPIARIEKVIHDLPSELSKLYSEIFSTLDPELAEDTANLMYLVLYAARPLDTDELRIGIDFMRSICPSSLEDFAALPEQVSYFRNFVTELSGGLFEVIDSGIPIGTQHPDLEESLNVKDSVFDWDEGSREAWNRYMARANSRRPLAEKQDMANIVETRWVVQVIHETVRGYLMREGLCHLPGKSLPIPMDARTGHLHLYQMCRRVLATNEMSCVFPKKECAALLRCIPDLVRLGLRWLETTIIQYALENIFLHLRSSLFFGPKDQCGPQWDLLSPAIQRDVHLTEIREALLRWECIRASTSILQPMRGTASHLQNNNFDSIMDRDLSPVLAATGLSLADFQACASNFHVALLTLHRHSFSFGDSGLKAAIAAVAHHGTEEELRVLLKDADPSACLGSEGQGALLMAIESRRTSIVEILLSKGAPANPPTHGGEFRKKTPLSVAIECRDVSVLSKLLSYGADVSVTANGFLPLALAASLGYKDVVYLLLDRGGRTMTDFSVLKRAAKVAMLGGHQEIATILMERAACQ
ncbi:uncharacterized protein PV07_03129 [Cladophialophora immunda]|uniref:Nephrocystin 3-like N-terminal domain-containing protein n=1 Tax=Cladophialophora immunda TaxID=569365 RepID=A0A0D2CK11_9EURO|nr:uncharacterized protein PV07_03129 [Cladophialophora immunda]KIW31483.1 hypothetical protein PV07_03129 [Cladophialophora immunda]